jgi:retron-type reverse transcriptase
MEQVCRLRSLRLAYRKVRANKGCPGRSAHHALKQASEYVADGKEYVVNIDLEKFFDRVNHDILMNRLARNIQDKRLLKLVRGFLQAGMMRKHSSPVHRTVQG